MTPIPITLTPVPVNVGAAPANMNQLIALIASALQGSISANVSFFIQGTVTPTTFLSALFFNQSQGLFYYWDTGSGAYLPISPFTQGDTKSTFIAGDNVNQGWIQLNGRLLTAIQGISAKQLAVLQSLFGAGGSLPTVTPLQAIVGLPVTGSFSNITNPSILPATGQFAGLTVNNPPQQTDVQAITSNAETLDDSVQTLQEAVASVITQSEAVLDSLLGTGATAKLYACVYVGPP